MEGLDSCTEMPTSESAEMNKGWQSGLAAKCYAMLPHPLYNFKKVAGNQGKP